MTQKALSYGRSSAVFLRIATLACAVAIFIADTMTDQAIAVAMLYVTVVLMASRVIQPRGVWLVAAGCVGLTVLSYYITPPAGRPFVGLTNMFLDIAAIGLTALLVTQGQLAEVKLREQANLLDLTHDGIFSHDMEGTITYWNRGAEDLYGWQRADALGKLSHRLLAKSFPVPREQIDAELRRTGRWEGEIVCSKKDGSRVIVDSRWVLQRDRQGQPAVILETNNNITERKQAEEALRQAQSNLERLNRVMLMGEMTASIAHEINQPIAAAITNASACLRWLAAQPPDMVEAREALGRIIRDGNRASEVIARIRALIRKVPPRRTRLNINEAILEVIALTDGDLRRSGITLQTRLSSALPPVAADRVQLQQVMLNLIANAIEAMSGSADEPHELTMVSGANNSGDVFVEVRDSGPGLDPASLDSLFDPFYTTKPEGMGMGLAISRSIVEAHGGRLSAAPNQPRGAVFRFTLPIEAVAATDRVATGA